MEGITELDGVLVSVPSVPITDLSRRITAPLNRDALPARRILLPVEADTLHHRLLDVLEDRLRVSTTVQQQHQAPLPPLRTTITTTTIIILSLLLLLPLLPLPVIHQWLSFTEDRHRLAHRHRRLPVNTLFICMLIPAKRSASKWAVKFK